MDHLRPKYMTPAEAAVHFRCCRQTIYKRVHRGTIPHRRFGDAILIPVTQTRELRRAEKQRRFSFPLQHPNSKGQAQVG